MKRWLWVVGGLAVVSACSRGGPTGGAADASSLRQRRVEELPAVGDYAPPVDDGRLLAAGPAGWSLLPRGRTYLIGFAKGRPSELPRIVINAQQPPEGSPEHLDAATAASFAQLREAALRSEVQGGRKQVEEYPLPIQLGPTVYVRHVRRASLSGTPCVVQALETVQHGRLYSIELIAAIEAARSEEYESSLLKWRDHGYAVAAHLQFAPPGERFDPLAAPAGERSAPSPAASEPRPASAADEKTDSPPAREPPLPQAAERP